MPRVSVIIPAFNAEQHIEETLRSVQGQTYDDWEIVVCDDGSTDRTIDRARSTGDRVAVVQTNTNSGPATARNLAIEHSGGELLAFLDADDYWLPTYLERQVSLFDAVEAQHGNVGIVACNAWLLDRNGLRPETHMEAVHFPSEVTLSRLLQYNPIFVSVLAPRKVVEDAGAFCPDLSGTADYDLWIRIVEAGYRVIATREALAVYRIGSLSLSRSLSSDTRAMARDMQRTYRRALERGNLSSRERRIACREIRRQRFVEEIASTHGLSYRRVLRALPLLLLVVAEHPRSWRSLPRLIARGRGALAPFPD